MSRLFKGCSLILLLFGIVCCLQVIPERIKVLYVNKEYFNNSKFYITRFGRKSPYYVNMEGEVLKPWYNNATFHLIFYEYLHNEYRRSFVEFHVKACDFLKNDLYIGSMLKAWGLSCPIIGDLHFFNMTFPTESFPNMVPFDKFLVDIMVNQTETNARMYQAHFYGIFKK